MIAYCTRCRREDGDWKRAIPRLRVEGDGELEVWRHRPCGELLARMTSGATA